MCGRYSFVLAAAAAAEAVDERYPAADVRWDPESRERYEGSYNVAPSTANPVVTRESPERLTRKRWGLVPQWADDPGGWSAIDARAETVDEKPAFRDCFERRRCLVPAQGFYEWEERDGRSRPHRVVPRDADHDLFLFAGIWSRWEPPDDRGSAAQATLDAFGAGGGGGAGRGDGGAGNGAAIDGTDDPAPGAADTAFGVDGALESYAILTMPANDAIAPIHDRMPVALRDAELATWLRDDHHEARRLLDRAGLAADEVAVHPVSRAVNDPGNDGPALWREA